ncbi:MAG: hypothetical protein H7840_17000 [Alphaproteobacteria bacterium]
MAETMGDLRNGAEGISDLAVDALSPTQKAEAGEILAGRPLGEASFAAIELGVGEDRLCPVHHHNR